MAKRLSSGQTNTLLNYFSSPKTPKVEKPPAPTKEEVKETIDNGSDDDDIIQPKKRKKLIIDSDEENVSESTPKKSKKASKPSKNGDGTPKSALKQYSFSKSNGCESPASSKSQKSEKAPAQPLNGDLHSNWSHNKLEFLQPDRIRDMNKRMPNEPDYDPHTLFVPQKFFDSLTPAMRQWWMLKSAHMDSVLFFKVGKFYELYHMDAVVGVTQLGISYMKGEFAHSGFPESAYYKMANSLIEKGFKVARVEQTETPEMMDIRCKKQGKCTKFDKVVKREICQITTKATCVYSAQLPEAMHSLPCYLCAITEKDVSGSSLRFGVCFIDTSIGVFNLAEFNDDKHLSSLLTLLAENPPGLILTEKKKISPQLKETLATYYKDIRKDSLAPESQFYSASTTIEKLMSNKYFTNDKNEFSLPDSLSHFVESCNPKPGYELSLKALGACLWYLEDSQLDLQVVSMGKFEEYQPITLDKKQFQYLVLDAITIKNLSLLGSAGSLQKTLDRCQTAFGKRLLQQCICRPLCNVDLISERQEAITEIYNNSKWLMETQSILKKLPDLERQVAKIHVYGNKNFAKNHPDSRAIFYEASKYSKRRIIDLLSTLNGFEQAQKIASIFKECSSPLLKHLTHFSPEGYYVDLSETIQYFKDAFDQEQAKSMGKIIPKSGVDPDFDQIEANIEEIQNKLNSYLTELQDYFRCKVSYFGSDKKRYQIEIPDSRKNLVTHEYQMEGLRKGYVRYSTQKSRQLLADMMKAEAERGKIVLELNRKIFEKFSERCQEWEQVIYCLKTLDVLCSFAEYARTSSCDMCMPEISDLNSSHKIVIDNGRHPCVTSIENFIPNDTKMGIENYPNVLIITGPNMGGKSTLMRQIALICIMAQMGSYIPASHCELNLIDRIFTRLGAHDDIVQGQSTFLVELSEASAILQHSTQNSLVLLDELGRGTSTHDGNAIATAYVRKLAEINCRALFSTHYHSLVDHFVDRADIQLGHMACMVENDEDPTEESVTFLYKMAKGKCPKSYGFNVARLAGLKHCIVIRGRQIAKELEQENKNRQIFANLFKNNRDISEIRKLLAIVTI